MNVSFYFNSDETEKILKKYQCDEGNLSKILKKLILNGSVIVEQKVIKYENTI